MLRTRYLITKAVAQIDEVRALRLIRRGLDMGADRLMLVDAVREGIERVSEKYHRGEYFLADLIMSAEIFKTVVEIVNDYDPPLLVDAPPIVFGTVEQDIHDIGKNIVIGLMRCRGLRVLDLGVDVPAAKFIQALKDTGSRVLCLSGLVASAYDSMRHTVAVLEAEGLRESTVVIIGGLVNPTIAEYVGADHATTDAFSGVELCLETLRRLYPQPGTRTEEGGR
ncbi:MAG: cobalamin-dependent protein [Clostridia bacterium]|nr:cobalamin-dependent protein [Clostridia bacterium]MDH7573071.1 cobalamin-dependent protein [Clostridia bacterium]